MKMSTKTTRLGMHRDDKAKLGAYYTDEVRALAIMVQDALGLNFTDYLLSRIQADARALGITDELGRINPEFKATYKALVEMCAIKRTERKHKK